MSGHSADSHSGLDESELDESGDDLDDHPLLCEVEGERRIPASACVNSLSRNTNAQKHINKFQQSDSFSLKAQLDGLTHKDRLPVECPHCHNLQTWLKWHLKSCKAYLAKRTPRKAKKAVERCQTQSKSPATRSVTALKKLHW